METASSYSGDLEYATKGRNKTGNKILVAFISPNSFNEIHAGEYHPVLTNTIQHMFWFLVKVLGTVIITTRIFIHIRQ
jgi:hypothetical protein